MLRSVLLTIHVLSVIVWLGCGLYELFLARELKQARGTPLELEYARTYLKYAAPVPVATILVALTGVLMATLLGWGFFQQLWLGTKQTLMLLVLIIFGSITPLFLRFKGAVEALPAGTGALPSENAAQFDRLEPWLIVMRILGTVAVILAIFRPALR
jgi:uncharacterized membrane protein